MESKAGGLTEPAAKPEPPFKLGAEKLMPEEQSRFIEAASEAGAGENEADFDATLKKIAKLKAAGTQDVGEVDQGACSGAPFFRSSFRGYIQ